MIGCTWMDGRGQLSSEASVHIMLYMTYVTPIYYNIQLILTVLGPSSMCIKHIQSFCD